MTVIRRAHATRFAALVAAAVLVAVACAATGVPTIPPGGDTASGSVSISPSPSSAVAGCPTSQPPALPPGETRTVTLDTAQGAIDIKVEGSLSPIAAGNFVALAECGWYTGTVFHRLVPNFVIQGGDGQYGRAPNVDSARVGFGGPGYTIKDEPVTATYGRGTVAMARTSAPDSQGSQFFIVLDDAARQSLERVNTYAIFGTVTSGMDVVDAIAAMPNSGPDSGNAALDPVAID